MEYIIDSRREYKAGRVFVTLGGPTVWVDTARRSVCLAWGAERAEYLLDIDAASAIDEILEEFYNC